MLQRGCSLILCSCNHRTLKTDCLENCQAAFPEVQVGKAVNLRLFFIRQELINVTVAIIKIAMIPAG